MASARARDRFPRPPMWVRGTVHCPGAIGRVLRYDIVEGTVAFQAQGRPADEAELRASPGAELHALATGGRADVLACVARAGYLSMPDRYRGPCALTGQGPPTAGR